MEVGRSRKCADKGQDHYTPSRKEVSFMPDASLLVSLNHFSALKRPAAASPAPEVRRGEDAEAVYAEGEVKVVGPVASCSHFDILTRFDK